MFHTTISNIVKRVITCGFLAALFVSMPTPVVHAEEPPVTLEYEWAIFLSCLSPSEQLIWDNEDYFAIWLLTNVIESDDISDDDTVSLDEFEEEYEVSISQSEYEDTFDDDLAMDAYVDLYEDDELTMEEFEDINADYYAAVTAP